MADIELRCYCLDKQSRYLFDLSDYLIERSRRIVCRMSDEGINQTELLRTCDSIIKSGEALTHRGRLIPEEI
jgi:hypothetical protein